MMMTEGEEEEEDDTEGADRYGRGLHYRNYRMQYYMQYHMQYHMQRCA